MRSSDVLLYIMSEKLVPHKWKGTMTIFILNWQDIVRQYEK